MQHVTAEKQAPSALDYYAAISAALSLERRLAKPGQSKALKDLLTTVVGAYNKMCTTKSHRINSNTKSMLYNLFLVLLNFSVLLVVPRLSLEPLDLLASLALLNLSKASGSEGTG